MMKRSLAFVVAGLVFFLAGIGSFLYFTLDSRTVTAIVLGVGCIVTALVLVNKGDPSRLPQASCWACGRPFDKHDKSA
jgi:hypothetical protein